MPSPVLQFTRRPATVWQAVAAMVATVTTGCTPPASSESHVECQGLWVRPLPAIRDVVPMRPHGTEAWVLTETGLRTLDQYGNLTPTKFDISPEVWRGTGETQRPDPFDPSPLRPIRHIHPHPGGDSA